MDNTGKRCLHGFFGVIVGSAIGWYIGLPEHFLIVAIIGAIFCGIAAFFLADEFWKVLRDYF